MLKIIVDREDNKQLLNITEKMWNNGSSISKFSGGITIKWANDFTGNFEGTWIPTSNISSSRIDSFILNIDNYIKKNKTVIFRDTLLEGI